MDYSDTEDFENDILGPEDLFMDECSVDSHKSNDRSQDSKNDEDKKEDIKKKPKEVKKKKKEVKGSRIKLNVDTLMGPHGLRALKHSFENFSFKGVNHEKEDLTKIMKILQQWMDYQLFPKGTFENTMAQLEALGQKKNVQTYMKKIRMGIDEWGETKLRYDSDENNDAKNLDEQQIQKNNFDEWLKLQMDIVNSDDDLSESELPQTQAETSFTTTEPRNSQNEQEITLTQEQLERIAKNKKLAEERKRQRLTTLE